MQSGSIHQLSSERENLFAFEVRGRIRAPDIEAMAGVISRAFDRLGKIDILIVIRQWDGIDAGAAFDPKALSVQARANAHVRKYGVVGAPGWAKAMIELFSPLTAVEERTFELTEEEEAWAWMNDERRHEADKGAAVRL